jgi:hypothetical protein
MPSVDDLRRNDSLFSRLEPAIAEEDSPALDAEDPTARRDVGGSSTDVPPSRDHGQSTIASSVGAHDKGLRSTVKVLKSILKKPRRWSVEVEKTKLDTEVMTDVPDEPSIDSSATANETISSLSLESKPIEHQPTAVPVNGDTHAQAAEVVNGSSLSSHKPPRSSLQIAAFDRKLFAIRGAELRDEYMRDTSAGGRESYE